MVYIFDKKNTGMRTHCYSFEEKLSSINIERMKYVTVFQKPTVAFKILPTSLPVLRNLTNC